MKYGSVCSGIEAATVAWHGLGWEPQWFSEIENFPSAVLEHHYPDVPNRGDMTKYKEWKDTSTIDLLVGGTPCQSFSVSGLRKGLEDLRGNLMLTYLAMAVQFKPKWIVWENVPGVLYSNRGKDFGTFLSALGQIGYGWAYRSLDAQYFGVPQRRRRVFVVGCLGGWASAGEVLFESESLSGHPAPCRKTRQEVADRIAVGSNQYSGFNGGPVVAQSGSSTEVPPTLDKSKTPTVAWSIMPMNSGKDYKARITDVAQPIMAGGPVGGNQGGDFIQQSGVRRLTPTECERLQGFPDNYTEIPYRNKEAPDCPTGPRYKALGNSMTVPVMKWIGERINEKEGGSNNQA
jgi:DNA (cytosine-5)-methyltransferase 1